MKIDINSNMGEGFGPYRIADDAALMAHISSCNPKPSTSTNKST
ncbi:LamB/YcsF family protein [Marinovum sp. 2_MG-2023]|nr:MULTISPECIES: LamB/YcsF family protein [unclassified Marinovum]MDO6729782.1 LamB/YcsF family protein [Marinovum sp. 2_MG-2023]MDO6779596.1 LamB/YcsF family protein [Marinovum sp. 1_MG-2023]